MSAVPASTFLNQAEITERLFSLMTWQQHLRALARWWTPWVEETREYIMCASIIFLIMSLVSIPWSGLQFAIVLAQFAWWLVKGFLLWRVFVTCLIVLVDVSKNGRRFTGIKMLWYEMCNK